MRRETIESEAALSHSASENHERPDPRAGIELSAPYLPLHNPASDVHKGGVDANRLVEHPFR